jgi:voltage-gated potassium channel
MTPSDPVPEARRPSLIDREVRRIATARSVTFGLALTFFALALAGGIVMRIVDDDNFPSLGVALWWAVQTITTVGYGDVVPTTGLGQIVGSVEMVLGVSFIAFLIAGVTSTVIQRGRSQEQDAPNADAIVDALTEQSKALTVMEKRLANIESKLRQ